MSSEKSPTVSPTTQDSSSKSSSNTKTSICLDAFYPSKASCVEDLVPGSVSYFKVSGFARISRKGQSASAELMVSLTAKGEGYASLKIRGPIAVNAGDPATTPSGARNRKKGLRVA